MITLSTPSRSGSNGALAGPPCRRPPSPVLGRCQSSSGSVLPPSPRAIGSAAGDPTRRPGGPMCGTRVGPAGRHGIFPELSVLAVKVRVVACLCAGEDDQPIKLGQTARCCRLPAASLSSSGWGDGSWTSAARTSCWPPGRSAGPGDVSPPCPSPATRLYICTTTMWSRGPTPGACPHPVPLPPGRTPRLLCAPADCPHPSPGTRRGANVEPGGTEWGPAPSTIEQTTADVQAIHRLAASRTPRATAPSPPATGPGTERRCATRPAPRSRTPSDERSGRPRTRAPHEEARSERTEAGGALGRRANGTEAPARGRGSPRKSPEPDGRRRVSAGD